MDVEATRMLNAIGDGHVVALILLEQLTGGIEGGLRVSCQSAGEGILTTKLINCIAAIRCAAGVLRDGELCLLLRPTQLFYAHLHAPWLLIGRTGPRSVFPPEVFGREVISVGCGRCAVDHGDGVEHVVGCKP